MTEPNLNSQIVDIINNFLQDNKLVDARTCEGEFLGMHSSLTIGGAHEVVEELEKLLAQQVREARIDELKQLEPPEQYIDYAMISGNDACAMCGFNAIKFGEHIADRIAALKGDDK